MQIGAASPRRRPQLVNLNLIPLEFRPRRFPYLTVGLALALAGAVLLLYGLAYLGGRAELEVARLQKGVAQAREVVNAAKGDATNANLERQRILAIQDDYRVLTERQISWSLVLDAIAGVPAGVRLDSVEQSGYGLAVRGSAPSYQVAIEYLDRLRESGLFHNMALEVTGEVPADGEGVATPTEPASTDERASTPPNAGLAPATPTRQWDVTPRPAETRPSATPASRAATAPPTSTPTATDTATPAPTRTPIPTPAFDYAVLSKTQLPRAVGANEVTYIRGRVEDESGSVVAGARLRIASSGDWSAEGPNPDSRNGTFEFPVTRGTFSLQVLDVRSEVATDLHTGSAGGSEAYDWEVIFRHTTMPTEATTDENGTPLPTNTPTQTPTATGTPISPGRNIAPDASLSASANAADARLAVDRDVSTLWNSLQYAWSDPGNPPAIRLDFAEARRIEGIELVVTQNPSGSSVHELWLMDEDGDWGSSPATTFQQSTSDYGVLAYRLSPARSVAGIYVRTTRSPSFVAWREIRVYEPIVPPGGFPTSTPGPTTTPSPTPISLGRNIAGEATLLASAHPESVARAADDRIDTIWSSEQSPTSALDVPPFIQLTYDQPRLVEGIELVVAQDPSGDTTHEVWLMDEDGEWEISPAKTFEQNSSDGQILAHRLSAARQILGVYVRTTRSPAFVAWREIRIYTPIAPPGGFPTSTPSATPTESAALNTPLPTGVVAFSVPPQNAASMDETQADHGPERSLDGTPTTSWLPARATPTATRAYLAIDLGKDNTSQYDPASDRLAAIRVLTDTATGPAYKYQLGVIRTTGATQQLDDCEFTTALRVEQTCLLSPAFSGIQAVTISVSPNDGYAGVAEIRFWRALRSGEAPSSPGSGPGAAPTPAQAPTPSFSDRSATAPPSSPPRALSTPPLVPRSTGRVEFFLLLETKPGSGYR